MIDHLGRAIASWLIPVNAWTAALLVCIVVVDLAVARHVRASLRIALYSPLVVRTMLPLTWWIPLARAPRLAVFAPLADAIAPASGSQPMTAITPYVGLALLYLAVAATLAIRSVRRRVRLSRALASSKVVTSIEAPCLVVRHAQLGPMVVGLVAPRIVLPEGLLDEAGVSALACVLRHEVAHVRRRDPWLSAAMDLLLVVAWPVVPLWLASARVRHLIELACDEHALSDADAAERRRYGHALLDLAERRTLAASGAGELYFGSSLRARIEALASPRRWPRSLQACLVGGGVFAFVACSSVGPAPAASSTAVATPRAGEEKESRLAPELIQGVVRANFGRFRVCYESAARTRPTLQGDVAVAFTIAEDGRVLEPRDNGSSLPDKAVIDCVVRAFAQLSFPRPEGGVVTVVYPVQFGPGD